MAYQRVSKTGRVAIAGLAAAAVFSGIVIFGIELIAIPLPVQSYFADGSDARMSARYWDLLEPDAQVVDRLPYRGVSVFGRAVTSHESLRESLPVWEALIDDLTPEQAASAGYGYIYVDEHTWRRLDDEQRAAYGAECAELLHEEIGPRDTFRWLYSVSECG